MASPVQTPSAAQPPPDVPFDPKMSDALTQYLRTFSLWCRNGFAASLRSQEALPGLMVRSWDTLPGHTPKIFMIRVSEAGAISATPINIGGDVTRRSVGSSSS